MQKYRRVKRNKKNAGKNVFTVFIIILTIVLIASLIRLYIRTDVGKINEDLKVERTKCYKSRYNDRRYNRRG